MPDDELPENVTIFPGVTPNEWEPNVILRAALKANLTTCLIVGWDAEGDFFFSRSTAYDPDVMWLIKHAEHYLMTPADEPQNTSA